MEKEKFIKAHITKIPTKKRETENRKKKISSRRDGRICQVCPRDGWPETAGGCKLSGSVAGRRSRSFPWEERLHLPHGWMGSRSTGWEEQRSLPKGWRARDSEWGKEHDLPHGWLGRHILQPQEVQCTGKTTRSCTETGAPQQATARHSPAGLPQADRTKIQLMMKRIKINSPAMWFSKGMMEMRCNKTAEEPKKQNACTRKRVALEEEEDRVKMDRWMTKVWTMFTKHPHVVHSPYHPCIVSLVHHVINSPSWPMPFINHAIHSHSHPFTIPSIHHVIHSPCHLYTMSSFRHDIHSTCHPFTIMRHPFIYHVIHSSCNLVIHSLRHPFTMSSSHQHVHSQCHQVAMPSINHVIHSSC